MPRYTADDGSEHDIDLDRLPQDRRQAVQALLDDGRLALTAPPKTKTTKPTATTTKT